jgi:hypothetical protein
MMLVIEMASCGVIYLQSFKKIGTGVEEIVKFCFSSLSGFNVGTTDGRDL